MNFFKIGLVFLVCLVLTKCQDEEEVTEKDPEINDSENDYPPEKPVKAGKPETPKTEENPNDSETPEESPETPEESPETPEESPETPEESPETPEKSPETPEESPETPERSPETPEESPETPEKPETPETSGTSESPEPAEERPEKEPVIPAEESSESASQSPPDISPKETPGFTLITIGRIPLGRRCLLCNIGSRGFPRNPFRPIGDDSPSFFRIPERERPPTYTPNRRSQERPERDSRDPLANFTRPQRLRQLIQDMMTLECKKFEVMINEFKNVNEEKAENEAMDNVLKGLNQFLNVLKENQIFNITEILKNHNNHENNPNNPNNSDDFELIEPNRERNRPRFEPIIRFSSGFD